MTNKVDFATCALVSGKFHGHTLLVILVISLCIHLANQGQVGGVFFFGLFPPLFSFFCCVLLLLLLLFFLLNISLILYLVKFIKFINHVIHRGFYCSRIQNLRSRSCSLPNCFFGVSIFHLE